MPYETSIVVTGCGPGSGCTYTWTYNDDTPGATMTYMVFEAGIGEITWGTVTSGVPFSATQQMICNNGSCYPAGSIYGYIYATAPGYSQSDEKSLF